MALLNVGASVMNINIVRGGIPLFTRDVSVGGNQYTDALQKELDLSYEDAERLKKGEAIAGVADEHRDTILRSVSDILILEIQKTFDFFRATASGENIQRIYIAGGTARVPGLVDLLREEFALARRGAVSVPQDRHQSGPAQRRPGARAGSAPGHCRRPGAQELRHAMIRINLLGRARPKAQRQAVPLEATLQVVFLAARAAARVRRPLLPLAFHESGSAGSAARTSRSSWARRRASNSSRPRWTSSSGRKWFCSSASTLSSSCSETAPAGRSCWMPWPIRSRAPTPCG